MIFVSAGHYPSAPGARWKRFVEHDEAAMWSQLIAQQIPGGMLVPTGVLRDKVDFINSRIMNGDIAIEVHFNAARDKNNNPIGKGCESLYYPGSDRGKLLAEACQEAMAPLFPPNRGAKEGWYRMDPNRGPDFFLSRTKCTAVIVEPEFVHRANYIYDHRIAATMALAKALMDFEREASPIETTLI